MPGIPSNTRLYLQYRLWIADMNADITVLRIFDDHLAELSSLKKSAEVKKALEDFSKQFSGLRNEIDELKHEMHLVKMRLAANLRRANAEEQNIASTNNHSGLEKRYTAFRKKFDKLKNDFVEFEP